MCTLKPCLNGSTCNDANDGTRTCACVGSFEGTDCECDGPCDFPDDTNIFENQWPSNDNCQEENPAGCLGGAIGAFRPSSAIENGTCTISFPEEPAYFHVFDAHIRADVASTPSTWNICAANSFFEPGEDGAFRYLVYFAPGSPFSQEDVVWDCDSADEYTYAIYSFPQNYKAFMNLFYQEKKGGKKLLNQYFLIIFRNFQQLFFNFQLIHQRFLPLEKRRTIQHPTIRQPIRYHCLPFTRSSSC